MESRPGRMLVAGNGSISGKSCYCSYLPVFRPRLPAKLRLSRFPPVPPGSPRFPPRFPRFPPSRFPPGFPRAGSRPVSAGFRFPPSRGCPGFHRFRPGDDLSSAIILAVPDEPSLFRAVRQQVLWPSIHGATDVYQRRLLAEADYYERKWGIHLTQVTPRCSMWLRGGLPARFA